MSSEVRLVAVEKDDGQELQRRLIATEGQRSPGRAEFRAVMKVVVQMIATTAAWERMDVRVSAQAEAKFLVHDLGIQPYATVGYIP
jgi:hypothetical protein